METTMIRKITLIPLKSSECFLNMYRLQGSLIRVLSCKKGEGLFLSVRLHDPTRVPLFLDIKPKLGQSSNDFKGEESQNINHVRVGFGLVVSDCFMREFLISEFKQITVPFHFTPLSEPFDLFKCEGGSSTFGIVEILFFCHCSCRVVRSLVAYRQI